MNIKDKRCVLCGAWFSPNGLNAKYCSDCAANERRRYHKEWMRDFRERKRAETDAAAHDRA